MYVPVKYFCLFIYENLKSFPVNIYLYQLNITILQTLKMSDDLKKNLSSFVYLMAIIKHKNESSNVCHTMDRIRYSSPAFYA